MTRLPAALCLLLAPLAAHAQTPEIQREVDDLLWRVRWMDWIEATTGLPPVVALLTLLVLVLAAVAGAWLWFTRRKREE
jgi:hypothetical protein